MFELFSTTLTGILLLLILLLVTLIVITIGVVIIYSGLFISPEVGAGKPPFGKVVYAYKFCKGPYKEAGQLFTEAVIIAPEKKTLGIYYDDPRKVESSHLRYVVGSIIAQDSEPIDEALAKKFTEKGFKIMTLPEVEHAVNTSFPYITTLSIVIGVYKVFPRMNQYIEERNLCAYPYLEYCTDQTTHYFAPLSKQEDFFAPECLEDQSGETLSADFNETMESTQSSISDSLIQDITFDTSKEVTPSLEEEVTEERVIKNLESRELSSKMGDGNGDQVITQKISGEGKEANNGNSDEDAEDNSSSSSFEVVKNETAEI